VYRNILITKVIPAIKTKFPGRDKNVVIQQDGANAHILETDAEFLAAGSIGYWKITVWAQPARSPDFNHLDLIFFRALQSSFWSRGFAANIDEMIDMVEPAYWNFESIKMEKGFITLATCIDQVLICAGDNDYKLPHLHKDKMIREGTLPKQ
jgi:hypothetical protein